MESIADTCNQPINLSDALQRYWLEKEIAISVHTRSEYNLTFTRLKNFLGNPSFAAITADDLRRFLAHVQREHTLGKKSVCNVWIALSSLWTWAERECGYAHIIRGRISRPRFQSREIEPFEPSEIHLMLDAASWQQPYATRSGRITNAPQPTALRDKAILFTLLDSGLRAQELCSLTVGDYDSRRGRLHVRHGKGDKSRVVPLGQRSQGAIGDYLESRPKASHSEPLFSTRTGTHIERGNLGNLIERIASRAGVHGAHPHKFRHTFAINFLRAGGNTFLLQVILGHSTLEMTQRYARIAERDINGAGRFSPADRILTDSGAL